MGPPAGEKRVYTTTVAPLFSRSVARPRGHRAKKKAMVYTIFLGKQGKRVYTIGPERRVYTIEPQTWKKKKRVVSTVVVYFFFFSVRAQNWKKSRKMSSRASRVRGPKSRKRSRKRVEIVEKQSILTLFRLRLRLFGPRGREAPGTHFPSLFPILVPNDPWKKGQGIPILRQKIASKEAWGSDPVQPTTGGSQDRVASKRVGYNLLLLYSLVPPKTGGTKNRNEGTKNGMSGTDRRGFLELRMEFLQESALLLAVAF